jgi:hypothetical protein
MDNITLTTPSGWKAVIKPFMTFGDKRALERVFAEGMTLDSKGDPHASGKSVYDAQDKAVSMMVKELVAPDGGNPIVNPEMILAKIMAMPEEDGRMIYDKVNELTNPTPQGEKRGS